MASHPTPFGPIFVHGYTYEVPTYVGLMQLIQLDSLNGLHSCETLGPSPSMTHVLEHLDMNLYWFLIGKMCEIFDFFHSLISSIPLYASKCTLFIDFGRDRQVSQKFIIQTCLTLSKFYSLLVHLFNWLFFFFVCLLHD